MPDYFIPRERDMLFRRIEQLSPEQRSRDGKINGHQLVGHFNNSLREICGLQPPSRHGNLAQRTLGKWLVFHLIPWPESPPKNSAELAEFVGSADLKSFADDHADFVTLLQAFERHCAQHSLAPHPLFGRLSQKEWGKYMFLHLDYHLTMFDIHGEFHARK